MSTAGFHVMVKPGGSACNIDCDYCYFLSKQQLYPEGRHRMSDALLESYIRQMLECQGDGEVSLAWQGGEPTLLGIEFYRRAVVLAEKYRRPGQIVRHSIQTNGLLLDDKWCVFLRKNNFLVGISIDGPPELHDLYRKDKNGRGTFHLVMKAVQRLKAHGVDFNILCTVNAGNQRHGRAIYTYFRDVIGAEWIQFIPLVERVEAEALDDADRGWRDETGARRRPLYLQQGDRAVGRSVGRAEFGRFLIEVFDEWVRHDVGRVFVQHFEAMLAVFFGQYLTCTHAPTCGRGLALEHNGDLYCCDHYVEPDYRLGNIRTTPLAAFVASTRLASFGAAKQTALTRQCLGCEVRAFCHGGCPKDRFDMSRDGEPGQNYLCSSFGTFFSHALPAMKEIAALVRSGRPATDVMKPGRR
jgi:uncharacterized protein